MVDITMALQNVFFSFLFCLLWLFLDRFVLSTKGFILPGALDVVCSVSCGFGWYDAAYVDEFWTISILDTFMLVKIEC